MVFKVAYSNGCNTQSIHYSCNFIYLKFNIDLIPKYTNFFAMTTKYEHKGHAYWVTVEKTLLTTTNQQVYVAYVSDNEPGGLFYGTTTKGPDGRTLTYESELAAKTDANHIKQSEIDSRA